MTAGDVFGRLTLLALEEGSKPKKWRCRCECGTVKVVRQDHIRSGASRSCGCERNKAHRRLINDVVESAGRF